MIISQFMDEVPLWGILLASVLIIVLATEFGFRLGRWQHARLTGGDKIKTGPVVTASLGLLAFMLAFTFGAVTKRFDDRKQLVLDEANAIGTAYLRADLLPEPDRDSVRRLLYDYVNLRLETVQLGGEGKTDDHFLETMITQAEKQQNELWSIAVSIADRYPTPISALFLQSLNELIDLHQMRITVALQHRMPGIFWFALCGLTILAMIVGGYDAGLSSGRRSVITTMSVALAFSLVMLLVVALDRPKQRLSVVNQAALMDVQRAIERSLKPLSE